MDDVPSRLRFYVARRSSNPNSARPVDAVGDRGAVRFYDDPTHAHDDADRRGGRAAGFVVLAVFIGADGNPNVPRIEFAGQAAQMSPRATRLNGLAEAYRLRIAVKDEKGRIALLPIDGETRLFSTYREATVAARGRGGSPAGVVTQAVMLDADREVVFPPDSTRVVSRGNWRIAPKVVFWQKGEMSLYDEYGRRPTRPGRDRLPGRRKRRPGC